MWIFLIGLALLVGKLLDFGPLAELSWWWVVLPFVIALVWWEFFERRLGLDKKKAFDELEKAKQERIARALEREKSSRHLRR
ncbi:MAG: TIGR04438 family Trp-rich protein [Burkholderiales bacterium]|jgi:small Trp-rich protein|nr:MAG: TIGR04438 family Trp-rich protein [Burkholderiales bacterium]